MVSTFVYFSALCTIPTVSDVPNYEIPLVVVKRQLFGVQFNGFDGKPVFSSVSCTEARLASIGDIRRKFQNRNYSELSQVRREDAEEFGIWAAVACQAHGEHFSTWVGGLYLTPFPMALRGLDSERFICYLVTEAPELDCGHWEGDQLPVRG